MQTMVIQPTQLEDSLFEVFAGFTGQDFKENPDLRDTPLLGELIGLRARDMLFLLFRIEEMFGVKIPDQAIAEGRFNTFNNIQELIGALL